MHNNITYQGELFRKGIHISSSFFAFLLYLLGKETIMLPLILITIIYLILDYGRRRNVLSDFYLFYFDKITRPNEKFRSLTGASYVFLGITLTILFFDQRVAIPSILIMSLSDSASAIIGRKYNYTKIYSKSLEGSIAFYFTTLIILLFFNFNIYFSFFIALVLTFIEFFDKLFIDDNISLPIVSALLIQFFLI